MISRITLQNYMSHPHTVIEPASGLTVLVGPNNCGKSAVVSAIQTLCNNTSGNHMIRHDEKEARITINTDDGHTFIWRRKGNAVSYIVDGREIHRVRGSIPEDLHKLLKLPRVEIAENGDPFDIHFGTQKSPIFLLNEPEGRIALFFAASSDAAILLEMQKRHRNKVQERKRDQKGLNQEIEKLSAELAALEPIKTIAISVQEAESQYHHVEELQSQIWMLDEAIRRLHFHSKRHDRLGEVFACFFPLASPPSLSETSSIETLLSNLHNADLNSRRSFERFKATHPLLAPPALQDDKTLDSIMEGFSLELKNFDSLLVRAGCFSSLQELPEIADTQLLMRLLQQVQLVNDRFGVLSQRQHVLNKLMFPPELIDREPMAELISLMDRTSKEISRQDGLLKQLEHEIRKINDQIVEKERSPSLIYPAHNGGRRRGMVLGLGAITTVVAVVLFFIFAPTWSKKPKFGSSTRAQESTEVPSELPKESNSSNSQSGDSKKEKGELANQSRIKEVQKLLANAETADAKGKHLEAVLGYAQAAILYADELPEVRSPGDVRLKFVAALKGYQAEVEEALKKAKVSPDKN